MNEGWQLLRIRGIPLRIHPTWFLILVAATLVFQRHYREILVDRVGEPGIWLVALATAILLFVSVLLHELGHSLVAIGEGVKVRSITLFLLGGVASVERECPTAIGALKVALAGPLVSLMLGIGLLAAVHSLSHASVVLGEMATQLGALNLVLALFNMLPGLPLDGGLVVKALVWQVTGSRRRGIEVANACGRLLSFLAIGLGSVLLLRGGGIGGAWLILLGWFGIGAARNQRQLLLVQQALRDLRVRDVAGRRFRVLEADATLRQMSRIEAGAAGGPPAQGGGRPGGALSPGAPAATAPDWILICDRGRWRGYIDDRVLQQLPVQRWDSERVGHHLRPLDELPAIADAAPLWQAVLRLDQPDCGRLLVLGPAGLPSGTLERPELGEAVLRRLGLRLPPALLETARRSNLYPLGLALPQIVQAMLAAGEVRVEGEPGGTGEG